MRNSVRIRGVLFAIALLVITLLSTALAGERTTRVGEGITIGLGAGLVIDGTFHPAMVYHQPVPSLDIYDDYYMPAPPVVSV